MLAILDENDKGAPGGNVIGDKIKVDRLVDWTTEEAVDMSIEVASLQLMPKILTKERLVMKSVSVIGAH